MITLFFNLLANATFSLVIGLIIVGFAIWLFRVPTGPWKVFLLSLPFVKIVYDFFRGLPANSILLSHVDPFNLPPKHQLLRIGAGITNWAPNLEIHLSVLDTNGQVYSASIGDYLVIWLNRYFGDWMTELLVALIFTVAFLLLATRLYQAWRFERERHLDRQEAFSLKTVSMGFRKVDVYISPSFSGSPFTGGLLKPYICIPLDSKSKLSADELEAVVAHELGHVHQFDLIITIFVQTLGDLFWFVPGYRWLSRKIDRLREMIADQWAVRKGVRPELLASALIKLKEIPDNSSHFVLYSAFFREKSLLKVRIENLLGQSAEEKARFGWNWIPVRVMASFFIVITVIMSTFGGNHPKAVSRNPQGAYNVLRILGLIA